MISVIDQIGVWGLAVSMRSPVGFRGVRQIGCFRFGAPRGPGKDSDKIVLEGKRNGNFIKHYRSASYLPLVLRSSEYTLFGLSCAGNAQQCTGDAAIVALSFARAHAPWLNERFALKLDPRARTGRNYSFSVTPLRIVSSGQSAMASFAGRLNLQTRLILLSTVLADIV